MVGRTNNQTNKQIIFYEYVDVFLIQHFGLAVKEYDSELKGPGLIPESVDKLMLLRYAK